MKSKFIIILMFSLNLSVWGQVEWHESLEPPFTGRFDDIFFLNENLGWAAGNGGYVFKTTDGGQNWEEQVLLYRYIRNIEFVNENVGFIGTLENIFFRTDDGGATWVEQALPIPSTIADWAICGMDAVGDTVYACGAYFEPAYVLKSVNAGTSWQYIDMSAYATALVEIMFVDQNVGYASGSNTEGGIIIKTTDGGSTWTQIHNTNIPGEYVWKLQRLFSNPNVMFGSVESVAPLNGKLLKSVDGGVNWVSKDVPDTAIQAVGFIDENHGWMGGYEVGFIETFDAGTTWTEIGLGELLNRIQVFDSNLAYCAGAGIYKLSDANLGTKKNSKSNSEKLEVMIAPNPVENQLEFSVNFKNEDHLILKVFDAKGKLVATLKNERIATKGKRNYSFPFPYAAGTYYLSLHFDMGMQAEKIIKN